MGCLVLPCSGYDLGPQFDQRSNESFVLEGSSVIVVTMPVCVCAGERGVKRRPAAPTPHHPHHPRKGIFIFFTGEKKIPPWPG